MPDDTQNVPQWFSDFAVKNADEHGQLAARIEASSGQLREEIAVNRTEIAANRTEIARAETRSTRWTAGLVIGGITVGVSVLTTIIILVN